MEENSSPVQQNQSVNPLTIEDSVKPQKRIIFSSRKNIYILISLIIFFAFLFCVASYFVLIHIPGNHQKREHASVQSYSQVNTKTIPTDTKQLHDCRNNLNICPIINDQQVVYVKNNKFYIFDTSSMTKSELKIDYSKLNNEIIKAESIDFSPHGTIMLFSTNQKHNYYYNFASHEVFVIPVTGLLNFSLSGFSQNDQYGFILSSEDSSEKMNFINFSSNTVQIIKMPDLYMRINKGYITNDGKNIIITGGGDDPSVAFTSTYLLSTEGAKLTNDLGNGQGMLVSPNGNAFLRQPKVTCVSFSFSCTTSIVLDEINNGKVKETTLFKGTNQISYYASKWKEDDSIVYEMDTFSQPFPIASASSYLTPVPNGKYWDLIYSNPKRTFLQFNKATNKITPSQTGNPIILDNSSPTVSGKWGILDQNSQTNNPAITIENTHTKQQYIIDDGYGIWKP